MFLHITLSKETSHHVHNYNVVTKKIVLWNCMHLITTCRQKPKQNPLNYSHILHITRQWVVVPLS